MMTLQQRITCENNSIRFKALFIESMDIINDN